MKFVQMYDGDGWEIRNKEIFAVSCCDCGLVHDLAVYVPGKRKGAKVGIAARRNESATKNSRKNLKK